MKQKPTNPPIENEAKNGLKNDTYTVAMARTAAPHSASAQFFINVKNNSFLDYPGQDGWGYAVFGKVIKGTDIVDKIKAVETANGGSVPSKPVVIESASVIK
jgi:cyclophilin family peptidyl-prolyl cis-trans isomerase